MCRYLSEPLHKCHNCVPVVVDGSPSLRILPLQSLDPCLQISPFKSPSWSRLTIHYVVQLAFVDTLPLFQLGDEDPDRRSACLDKPIPGTVVGFHDVVCTVLYWPGVNVPACRSKHSVSVHPIPVKVCDEPSECRKLSHQCLRIWRVYEIVPINAH